MQKLQLNRALEDMDDAKEWTRAPNGCVGYACSGFRHSVDPVASCAKDDDGVEGVNVLTND